MNQDSESVDDLPTAGSGAHALSGYDYQVHVSVWVAIDLLLDSKLARSIVLEPSSEEDIEGEVAEYEPSRIQGRINTDTYTLVIQAKLRTTSAWTPKTISSLLNYGGPKRTSALDRLQNASVRYVLITSAGLNGDIQQLQRENVGSWPGASQTPDMIRSLIGASACGRLAIIPTLDEEKLTARTKALLTESFSVPPHLWRDCREKLNLEAGLRMRGANGGVWHREDIEAIIRQFEGHIASSRSLDMYVRPRNWDALTSAIDEKNALLIVGPTGTGKTLTSRMLFEHYRNEARRGLRHVRIVRPQQVDSDPNPPPVFFDIEDPWGKVSFEPDRLPWNSALPDLFATARSGRIMVATTRADVATDAKALGLLRHWIVRLEPEHYGPRERKRLYAMGLKRLRSDLQLIARDHAAMALQALTTPYEFQKFFDGMSTGDQSLLRTPYVYMREAIDRAQEGAIEETVIQQISLRGDLKAAAVVWGLLKIADKLSMTDIRLLEDELLDQDKGFDRGLRSFISFFVASRNFRLNDDGELSYYHARVEDGIKRALIGSDVSARSTLKSLTSALLTCYASSSVGVAMAARLVAAAGATDC